MGRIDTVRRREDTTRTVCISGRTGGSMPKKTTSGKPGRVVRLPISRTSESPAQNLLWRIDRLERQVHTLSELVREHAEDMDRLVRIVGEDREMLRRELLRQHHAKVRLRKHSREHDTGVELTST